MIERSARPPVAAGCTPSARPAAARPKLSALSTPGLFCATCGRITFQGIVHVTLADHPPEVVFDGGSVGHDEILGGWERLTSIGVSVPARLLSGKSLVPRIE